MDTVTKEEHRETSIMTNNIEGHIDRIHSGLLMGWVAQRDVSESIHFKVLIGDRVIAEGLADQYRDDLKKAGFGDGCHGFAIDISNVVASDHGKKVQLKTADSLGSIEHPEFSLPENELEIIILDVDGHNMSVRLKHKKGKEIGQRVLLVSLGDNVIVEQKLEIEESVHEFNIALPNLLIDGTSKLLKVSFTDSPYILAEAILRQEPIKTPWQYLKDSYNKPGFMSLPSQADARYESLKFNVDSILAGRGITTLENVQVLHNVLIQSYEGRTKFPAFSLPKFDSPEVSIIVPAYNKFELTYHCIASIAFAFNETSYEVILADDCSTDVTSEAENIIENLVVSRNEENLRFLKSCNQAAELAKGDFIIFLNNDTEVQSYWIDELVQKFKQDNKVGMTGSKLLNLDGTLQEAGGIVWENGQPWNVGRNANPAAPEYNYSREVDYLTGAAMCIRKELWQKVNGFSVELAPCYYEDTDIAFKVRKEGYKTVYVPYSVVTHFEGQSHGTDVTKGLKRYQVVNEKTFREKWFADYKNNGKASMAAMAIEKDRNVDQRVLVIDYATPMPNKDAGSYAAIQEIKLMQSLGYKVTFVPENLAHFGKYTQELQKMGVEVLYAPFYVSVDDVLDRRLAEMDAVYITRYSVAKKYIDTIKSRSKVKVLFNNADLHFLRELRSALMDGVDESKMEQALVTRQEELDVCRKVDAVLCYNSTEHAVITSHILQADKMHITPWVLEEKTKGLEFSERKGIAFLGGFNHFPNVEAVEYLVNNIMPLLEKKRPDIILSVYGSNMPEEMKSLETDNVKMVGFAESLDEVYHEHKVFVAPLLSGAGIKGKVLEAMAYGIPCVLTEVAAEGTGLTHAISTSIASSEEEWVEAIIELYDDALLWERFVGNQHILVEQKYSFDHGKKRMKEIFGSVGLFSTRN